MIVSVEQFRQETGSAAPAPVVERALQYAQERVEEVTGRLFDLAERTETLSTVTTEFGGLLAVFPHGYPVRSVVDPIGLAPSTDGSAVVGALAKDEPLTYLAGYDTETNRPPIELFDIIVELAERRLNPADTTAVPAGTTSVQNDGQGFSGDELGGRSAMPTHIRRALRKWRHWDKRDPR